MINATGQSEVVLIFKNHVNLQHVNTQHCTDCCHCIGFALECCLFKNKETMAWDIMQRSLHCCGVNNYTDWLLLPSLTVPGSCEKNVTKIPTDYKEYGENHFFTDGCYRIVKKKLDTDMMIINCRFLYNNDQ